MSRSTQQHRRRVVITGLGVVSPAGCSLESYWEGITSGRSAISKVSRFDTSELGVHTAGEVDIAPFKDRIPPSTMTRPDYSIQLGLFAADQALQDAGINKAARDGLRIGAILGSGLGSCDTMAGAYMSFVARGIRAVRPTTIPRCMFNGIASEASIAFHLTGSHSVTAAACASASIAMGYAFDAIVNNREDVVLTGGCDSPLTQSIYIAWVNLRVLSAIAEPEKAMRPFDRDRAGFVLSEGAGMLVFEELEHALKRGATIYGEVLSHGTSSDALHITKPSADGQTAAITNALQAARLAPEEVDYINAHGTATLLNDPTETEAIKRAFGDHAARIPISSTKSVLGHTMGASAAIEMIATLLAFKHQTVPPTVNLDTQDPSCDLDYVPNRPRPARLRTAISNSFAFGGSNSVLAVRTYGENDHG